MNRLTEHRKLSHKPLLNIMNPISFIQHELDKALDNINEWLDVPSARHDRFDNLSLSPAIDIIDDKKHFKVEVEMPGMSEEDIKVYVQNGTLYIRGEKATSTQDKNKHYLTREINYGSYQRSITLPNSLDIQAAKASFKKGILWIVIPKKAEAMQLSHEIKVEKAAN